MFVIEHFLKLFLIKQIGPYPRMLICQCFSFFRVCLFIIVILCLSQCVQLCFIRCPYPIFNCSPFKKANYQYWYPLHYQYLLALFSSKAVDWIFLKRYSNIYHQSTSSWSHHSGLLKCCIVTNQVLTVNEFLGYKYVLFI